MTRVPLEEPEGQVYQPELLTVQEERNVLDVLQTPSSGLSIRFSVTFRTLR